MLTLLALLVTLTPPDSTLVIEFEQATSDGGSTIEYELDRDGLVYTDGTHVVPTLAVWILRVIVAAEKLPDSSLADMGINEAQCAQHRSTVLRCLYPPGHPRHGITELPGELRSLAEPNTLLRHLQRYLLPDKSPWVTETLSIELDGAPELLLGGVCDQPWGFPWSGRSSNSLLLSKAIATVLPPHSSLSIINAEQYCADAVWCDPKAWQGLRAEIDRALDVIVEDTLDGCAFNEEGNCSYWLTGAGYIGPRGTLTSTFVGALRRRALGDPWSPEDALRALGVSAADAARQRPALVAATVPDGVAVADLPQRAREALTVESIDAMAVAALKPSGAVYSIYRDLSVTLPGVPPVKISSDHWGQHLLPWTVSVGERSWQTYDPWISQQLALIVAQDGPSYEELIDAEGYFRFRLLPGKADTVAHAGDDASDEQPWTLWQDVQESLQALISDEVAREAIQQQMGPEWSQYFRIADATDRGNGRQGEFARRQLAVVDGVWMRWHPSRPPEWAAVLSRYLEAEAQARSIDWLTEWRAAADGRTIRIDKHMDRVLGTTWGDYTEQWEERGLDASNFFALGLYEDGREAYEVHVFPHDQLALVTCANFPAGPKHWIDHEIVESDGGLLLPFDEDRLPRIAEPTDD